MITALLDFTKIIIDLCSNMQGPSRQLDAVLKTFFSQSVIHIKKGNSHQFCIEDDHANVMRGSNDAVVLPFFETEFFQKAGTLREKAYSGTSRMFAFTNGVRKVPK